VSEKISITLKAGEFLRWSRLLQRGKFPILSLPQSALLVGHRRCDRRLGKKINRNEKGDLNRDPLLLLNNSLTQGKLDGFLSRKGAMRFAKTAGAIA
jgi:hypothetical protein